jgi:hypothetical protein
MTTWSMQDVLVPFLSDSQLQNKDPKHSFLSGSEDEIIVNYN